MKRWVHRSDVVNLRPAKDGERVAPGEFARAGDMIRESRQCLGGEFLIRKMNMSGYIEIDVPRVKRGDMKNMVIDFMLKIVRCRFSIYLNSPDGNSGRTLVFITRPKKNLYRGIKIMSWHNHEFVRMERFMEQIGIYPQW